jgi:hypothetical protein
MLGFHHFLFNSALCHVVRMRIKEVESPHAEPHMGGNHAYDRVLPDALKVSFITLLSPPQCYAALGTMPHILAQVVQSPV